MDVLNLLEAAGLMLAAVIVILLPWEIRRLMREGRFDAGRRREMLASAAPLVPVLATAGLVTAWIAAVYGGAARLAPFTIPTTPLTAVLAVLLVDFLYYWDHRAGHRVAIYWALAHSVHHSSTAFDQTTGLRISFVDGFVSPWFYLPLVLIGFDPLLVIAALGVVIGYQQWLHTEAVDRLPWLDSWLNTPSNHRVHHGVQPRYHDCNYGAILMVWDRLFGTYVAESEPLRYGITEPLPSRDPWTLHVAEARRLWAAWSRCPDAKGRLRLLFGPPGQAA
jgi:sterol desaturase/sphingolipid hydroxylase (fatty acid hydroxylase superfamily)